ncbi:sigma-54-dependent Fis family transcriptional regulator [Ferrimonas lipolytica]|uniref:Sigma-54-dependent Fis family transcriptional regulator n=1 Tax=Ferrimonas lipolytica TaxID=2724191 RepID=A0A6H1UB66_9GAMM|nr:sigma-54-dependent Fis family transcriptional regulator [Ferrimonas lipolytica]QIZ76284.1 sigma-54-dependent Fis family transcriptional regulator [Ferrimonas lipolytica]
MKIEELSLSSLLSHSSKDASVHFMQQRVLIFDALSQGLLRKELLDTFGYHKTRKVLTRFGFAHGWRTAQMIKSDFPEVLDGGHGGEYLHQLLGLVNTTKLEMTDGEGEQPLIRSEMENSFEVEQHLNLIGPANECVCWTLVGFASGYETFKHNREVYFIETKCVAKGDPYCEMEGRFKERWDGRLDSHLPYFEMDSSRKALDEQERHIKELEQRLSARKQELSLLENPIDPIPGFIARSPNMTKLINIASRAAQVNATVLVSGSSGVGKEHISRYVHQASSRSNGPFISVNCGALSETLLEAELFGHTKGAFTGADKARTGLFEEANGGTIFLDEIGETSLNMQVKLLRVLQEKEVKRIGENISRSLDVRVIVATNRNLSEEVNKGNFRQDLFYRLRVIELNVPNLAERREDIVPIANLFLLKFNLSMERNIIGLSRCVVKRLMDYSWPGNVRELANTIEYAVALCNSEWIEESDLPAELTSACSQPHCNDPLLQLETVEKQHILAALEHHQGDKIATATSLGIALSTLYRKLSLYHLA